MESTLQDLRWSIRSLGKNIGFTLAVILTLSLGVGSCTAIFSLMSVVIFPHLPYGDVDALVYLTTPNRNLTQVPPEAFLPDNADFADIQRQSSSFLSMAQFKQVKYRLSLQGKDLLIDGAQVDKDFFATLQSQPILGRAIGAEDDQRGHSEVAMISHSLWLQLFAANKSALGRSLQLNGTSYRIVGIMPADFNYPHKTDLDDSDAHIDSTDIWTPLALTPKEKANRGLSSNNYALARLQPGISIAKARAQATAIMERLDPLHDPDTLRQGWYAYLKPFRQTLEGSARPLLWMLFGAVTFVLFIACGNAANLLLARGAARSHELGVRATLGAGRMRLIRQMMTESVVLGIGGGITGVGLSWLFLRLLLKLDPGNIPRLQEASLNTSVLVFTVAATVLTSVVTGILPALRCSRVNLVEYLGSGGNRGAIGAHNRLRNILIVAQVAIVVVLLSGAGLLLRSYINVQAVRTGFSPSTLSMKIELPDRYSQTSQSQVFFRTLLDQMNSMQGVQSAGAVDNLPFGDTHAFGTFWVEGYNNQRGQMVDGGSVTPGYFSAMGVPLLEGRTFGDEDRSGEFQVAIVNQAFANKYFAYRNPLGQRVWTDLPNNGAIPRTGGKMIVGVVADMRDLSIEHPPQPQLFVPFSNPQNAYIVVRSILPPEDVAVTSGSILSGIDSTLSFTKLHTMGELLSDATARRRFQTVLLTIFSVMALVLALVGFYGLLSYAVRQRRAEMGVRIALGASRTHIKQLILRQGLQLVLVGLLLGLAAASALTRLLASSLYEVSAWDPITFAIVPALLLLTAAVACLIPANRASTVNPITALRYE